MSKILEQIEQKYLEAMKSKDAERVSVLRMLKSALANAKIAKQKDLEESDEIAVLNKEVKSREDSISQYKTGNRDDLAKKEENEIEVIKEFLPEQIGDEELEKIIEDSIKEVGASSMADMGKVMQATIQKTKGTADNSKIAEIAKKKLL